MLKTDSTRLVLIMLCFGGMLFLPFSVTKANHGQNVHETPIFNLMNNNQVANLGITLSTIEYAERLVFSLNIASDYPYIEMKYEKNQTQNKLRTIIRFELWSVIEYLNTGNQSDGFQNGEEIQIYNLTSQAWKDIEYQTNPLNQSTLHVISTGTIDNVFSIQINFIENQNNSEILKFITMAMDVNNFPFQSNLTKLALNTSLMEVNHNRQNNDFDYSEFLSWNLAESPMNIEIPIIYQQSNFPLSINKTQLIFSFESNEQEDLNWITYFGLDHQQLSNASVSNPETLVNNPGDDFVQDSTFLTDIGFIAILAGFIFGLASIILLILRRLWEGILSGLIVIGTAIYIPNRKLSAVDALHNPSRSQIMDILEEKAEKGETLRNLSKNLHMPLATLLWHLQILEDFDFINRYKIRKESIIVSMNYMDKFDPILKETEMMFNTEQGRIFWRFLISTTPQNTFKIIDVVKSTQWHVTTARKHIKKLVALQVLTVSTQSNNYQIQPEYYLKIKSFEF